MQTTTTQTSDSGSHPDLSQAKEIDQEMVQSLFKKLNTPLSISASIEILQEEDLQYKEFTLSGSCIGSSSTGIPSKHGTVTNGTRFKKSRAQFGQVFLHDGQNYFVVKNSFVKPSAQNGHKAQHYLLLALLP